MKSHIFPVIEIIERAVVLVKTTNVLYPHEVSLAGEKDKNVVLTNKNISALWSEKGTYSSEFFN